MLWGAAVGVGALCLAQRSLPPPPAAVSCEEITARGELSVSEAGDKRRREDVTPGSLRRAAEQNQAGKMRLSCSSRWGAELLWGGSFSPRGAEHPGQRTEGEEGKAFTVPSRWI